MPSPAVLGEGIACLRPRLAASPLSLASFLPVNTTSKPATAPAASAFIRRQNPFWTAAVARISRTQQLHSQHRRPASRYSSYPRIQRLAPYLVGLTVFGIAAGIGARSSIATMSSKLIPSNPADVMVIRDVTPNVVTFSVPFSRFGTIKIGGRGTAVRLSSGAVALFSPVALTDDAKAKVDSLGPVKYIIALDFEHHIFLSEWAKAYPDAKLVGMEGLPEKRRAASADDPKIGAEDFAVVFTAANKADLRIDAEFDADFDYEYVHAHANKELVFHYRPDRVLIEADLMFNLPAKEQYSRVPEADRKEGFLARLFTSMQTTDGDAKGNKRFLWYAASSSDRPAFNESARRIDAWDFTTLIPCHGETIVGDAKDVFRKVFEWHLQGHK